MTTFYLLLWMALVTLACGAATCNVTVPDDCQPKCLNYGVNNVTNCSTCECISTNGTFEGDIRVDENSEEQLTATVNGVQGRGFATEFTLWTDYPNGDTYEIPYQFNSSLSSEARTAINDAILQYDEHTCIRLIPRTTQENYIEFFPGDGCWSYIGRLDGESPISIGTGCEYTGIVIHEIMHSLSFFHEQSRPDRDNYVRILTENIDLEFIGAYQKYSTSQINSMGSPYDYTSIMHYGPTFFSINGLPTMTKANGDALTETQRDAFAQTDIDQINSIYCKGRLTNTSTTNTTSSNTTTTPKPTTAATTTPKPTTAATTTPKPTTAATMTPKPTTAATTTPKPTTSATTTPKPTTITATPEPTTTTTRTTEPITTPKPTTTATTTPEPTTIPEAATTTTTTREPTTTTAMIPKPNSTATTTPNTTMAPNITTTTTPTRETTTTTATNSTPMNPKTTINITTKSTPRTTETTITPSTTSTTARINANFILVSLLLVLPDRFL